jgi:hypothetical protein
MAEKTTLEKLRLLLPHWLEHNQSHRQEFVRWAAAARAEGEPEIARLIEEAAAALLATDAALEETMARIGGPPVHGTHHHHHHHDE